MIWIPGGALLSGGSSVPNYDGTSFVENQNVILVSINYRVNIFGFPAAAASDGKHHNVGLLDQRMAVEWLYNNIYAFGGDATRMTLFGQSAGASSTDFFSYAWWNDPLVSGLIIQSGAVGNNKVTYSEGTSNFSYVASQVGCDTSDKDEELACMQSVEAEKILQVYEKYNATENEGKSLGFGASVDEETVFGNFSERRDRGLVAKIPVVIGNTENEYASLYSPFTEQGPTKEELDPLSNAVFACPAAVAANFRSAFGVPTWRYRYFGVFPNLNPLPWLGAYHASEIPIVFGTSSLSGPNTKTESELSRYMQGAWAAFAKDPVNGLEQYGWPRYEKGTTSLVLLGKDNATSAELAEWDSYDGVCS
jgi:carboxylesterase type B